MTFAETLCQFATEAPKPTEAVVRMVRLSLMDWAACGLAGVDETVAKIVRDMIEAEAGGEDASLFGGGQGPARAAALVNGTTSHALDYDDTHFAHIGHPSVAVFPAALAMAEKLDADGGDFLEAALMGLEASVSVGVWLGRDHYQTGFHQTATAGTFGAAIAAGRLLGLDAETMGHALGLAATKAAGLKSQFGTMGKPYNAGQAAAAGVEVALLAAGGFSSRLDAVDGPQGFGPTHAGIAAPDAARDLGKIWLFEEVSHKFHACCHGTHAMIEALKPLSEIDAEDIAAIRITTHPRWLSVCDIAVPRTGLEVKFSYRHIAAMVLQGHNTAALDSFSDANATDDMLQALSRKVEVVGDPSISEMQAGVEVKANGTLHVGAFDLAAPMTPDVRAERLRAKADALLGDAKSAALADICLAHDGLDIAGFAKLLRGQ